MQFTGNADTDSKIILRQRACQTNTCLSTLCHTNQDLIYKLKQATLRAKNVMMTLQQRQFLHLQPYRVNQPFGMFHDIVKGLSIREEPEEIDQDVWDEHPSNEYNKYFVNQLFLDLDPDSINIPHGIIVYFYVTRHVEKEFNPQSYDTVPFEMTLKQCETLLLHLFYNQYILIF